jgi:lipopolysaccharide transport system permease protein
MLSSALFVSAMGLVWTFLWKQPIEDMLPFLAVGMMVWQMITGILNESATALPASSHYFLNQYLPASTVLYAVFYRNGVMFLLNMVYPLLLCIAFGVPLTWFALCSAIGLVLVIVFCFSMAYVIAILCTRFRDIVQIVASFLNVVFFITPVLWKPEFLPEEVHRFLAWNPFAVLLTVIRDPRLGRPVSGAIWLLAVVMTVISVVSRCPLLANTAGALSIGCEGCNDTHQSCRRHGRFPNPQCQFSFPPAACLRSHRW